MSERTPLVSVIVPVYNVEKYVRECLESIRSQTYKNLEIIIVNDGSTDGSLEICEEFVKKDGRMRVYTKRNGGLSDARNYGLDRCKGDYICFVDSDDMIIENCIESLLSVIMRGKSEISVGRYRRFRDGIGGNPTIANKKFWETTEESTRAYLNKTYHQHDDTLYSVSFCAKLFKKKILDGFRFKTGALYEDLASIHEIMEKTNEISLIDGDVYLYRVSENSITSSGFNVNKLDMIDHCKEIVEHYSDDPEMLLAVKNMLVSRSIDLLTTMRESKYNDNEVEKTVWSNVKRYRKDILSDSDARKTIKIACVLARFGRKVTTMANMMFRNMKRGMGMRLLVVLYIIVLFVNFAGGNTAYSIFGISNIVRNLSLMALLPLLAPACGKRHIENEHVSKITNMILVVYVVILINSLLQLLLRNKIELMGESVVTVGMSAIAILVAKYSACLFGGKNIWYILFAAILNYAVVVISFVFRNGFDGLLNFQTLNDSFVDIGLEAHELIFIFGALLVHFVFLNNKKTKIDIVSIVLLLICFYLGMKRIVLGALLVLVVVMIAKKIVKNRRLFLMMFQISITFMVVGYLILSTVGLDWFIAVMANFDVDMMGRNKLYGFISKFYGGGLLNLGTGLRTTEYWLSVNPQYSMYGAVHNDILRIYVESGLLVFAFYFYTFIRRITKYILDNIGVEQAIGYCMMIFYTFFCYMTDNLFTYYRYILVLFAIIFCLIMNYRGRKK